MMKRFLLPLILFFVLVGFLLVGLRLNPREVPSPLIDKPVPHFSLTQLAEEGKTFSDKDMIGQVWLLNVWASWCGACRDEHPLMVEFSKQRIVPIIGLNYKDQRQDGMQWLQQFGNPYQVSAFDDKGRVGIDLGVYGVPETFLIDKHGVIRLKHIGPLTPEVIKTELLPKIEELNRG
jgi:cytochrome c biogenesis protein CcmG/thiol:disulfide interchange protein DsbE